MKSLLKKWARKFFLKQSRVFAAQQYVVDPVMQMPVEYLMSIRRHMCYGMIDKMIEEGFIDFGEETPNRHSGTIIRAKLHVL